MTDKARRRTLLRQLQAGLIGLAICSATGFAAPATPPAPTDGRIALVIGNSAYRFTPQLANPVNDARAMSAALRELGFQVIEGLDLDKRALEEKVRLFAQGIARANIGVLFYAGHGLQVAGRNYLLPVDARLASERDLAFEAMPLDLLLGQMEIGREGKTSIIFLDACRDNPLARKLARSMATRSPTVGRGLAPVDAGVGTFIGFATQPDNVALDGPGRNSPFTAALVRHIGAPGRTLSALMIAVRKDVIAATAGQQVPWDHSALTGEFYFVPPSAPGIEPSSAAAPSSPDALALRERMRRLEEELGRRAPEAGTPATRR
jgi:uncharacterized caspase-like protein